MGKKGYLDRDKFHQEMVKCKKMDKLTDEAVYMLKKLAEKNARRRTFEREQDFEDAVSSAIRDVVLYWRGFKESNVVRLKCIRNFGVGDIINIDIKNYGGIIIKAGESENLDDNIFEIKQKINSTFESLKKIITEKYDDVLAVYIDKVYNVVTFMDKHNSDNLSINSFVTIGDKIIDGKTLVDKNDGFIYDFKNPPNAFSYFTSMCNNGVLKYINLMNPKKKKKYGKTISMDAINRGGNGLYNI
jgi:hypothetical protein